MIHQIILSNLLIKFPGKIEREAGGGEWVWQVVKRPWKAKTLEIKQTMDGGRKIFSAHDDDDDDGEEEEGVVVEIMKNRVI